MSKPLDDWATSLGVDTSSPGYLQAKADVKARAARSENWVCVFGCCVSQWDPVDERFVTGVGRPGCPCDDGDDSLKFGRRA